MAQIDFNQIIDTVNYGDEPFAFILKQGADVIIPMDFQNTQNGIFNYLLTHDKIETEIDEQSEAIAGIKKFADFMNDVDNILKAPGTFTYDYIKNKSALPTSQAPDMPSINGVSRIATIPQSSLNPNLVQNTVFAVQFMSAKDVQVLESGIGKNFVWSKIAFKHIVDDQEVIKYGYCKLADLTNKSNNNKELIRDYPGLLREIFDKSSSDKVKPISDFYDLTVSDAEPDKIVFDKNTASYLILAPTGVEDFNSLHVPEGLSEDIRTRKLREVKNILISTFKDTLSQVIKKTMAFEKRSEKADDKNYEDKYYLFAKIVDYYVSPRPIEPLYILIKIPLRNIYATSTPGFVELTEQIIGGIDSAASYLRGLEGQTTIDYNEKWGRIGDIFSNFSVGAAANNDLVDEIYNNPTVNAGLNSLAGAAGSVTNGVLGQDDRTATYVDREAAKNVKDRRVVVPVKTFRDEFEKIADTLKYYKEEIDKQRSLPEKDQTIIYNADLFFYEKYFREFPNTFNDFLTDSDLILEVGEIQNNIIIFKFDNGNVSNITINNENYVIKGTEQFLENLPLNDETFLFLLCNFRSLHSLDPKQKPITDFLNEFIAPEELAYYKYVDAKGPDANSQQQAACLKSYKDAVKSQLKQNTNQFLADLKLGESKKNFEKTINGEEWKAIIENQQDSVDSEGNLIQDGAFTDWRKRFFDYSTLDWNTMIGEIAACISDKETRETVEWLALALKDKWLDNKPLLCSLPVLKIPSFPSIVLPAIPNFPSIIDGYLKNIENASILMREEMILSVIKGILDAYKLCEEADNSLDIGASNATDALAAANSQPLTSGESEDNGFQNNNRENQYKNAGLIGEDEGSDELEVLLREISKNLTKYEIASLYTRSSSQKTLRIVKMVVSYLVKNKNELPTLRHKLGSFNKEKYLVSEIKVIDFFAKFNKIINPQVVEEQINIQQALSNDPDIVCKDSSEVDSNYAQKLVQRGLSQENALAEAQKRRENVRNKLANLINAVNLLKKDAIQAPPLNCIKNPDGTITPGLSDKFEEPKELENIRDGHIETLYGPFDREYNSDFKNWFNIAVQTTPNLDQDGNMTGSTVEFLGFYKNSFAGNSLNFQNNVFSIVASPINLNSAESTDSSKFAYLSALDSKSNFIKNESIFFNSNGINFLTSSNESTNNYYTEYLATEDLSKIHKKFSFNSIFESSSSIEKNISFGNDSISNSNKSILIDKYFRKIKDRYTNSFYFKLTDDNIMIGGQNPLSGKVDQDKKPFKAGKSPIVSKIALNPIRTKKEILCKKPDLRLVNILDDIKKDSKKAMGKSCMEPSFTADGKKAELSPADKANNLGAIKLLLRLYAIDFNLKLLPYGSFLSMVNSDSFYQACYQIFVKDLENLFGVTFKNKIVQALIDQYIEDENIKKESEKNVFIREPYKAKAFIKYFKKDHFISVNKQIKNLLNNKINEPKFEKNSIWSLEEKDLFTNNYDDLLEYEFKNIDIINVANIDRQTAGIEGVIEKIFFIDNSGGSAKLQAITADIASINATKENIRTSTNASTRQNIIKTFLQTKSVTVFTKPNVQAPLQDKDLKDAFRQYFKYYVPFEEIYSLAIRNSLMSLSSINKLNSSFNSSKKKIKVILDTIEYANDFNKNIQDDGTTEMFSKIKVALKVPEFMVTALAETIDPNVAVASKISKAYEAGVAVATSAGIDIPIKKLPLFITAPLLFPAFLFPLSPVGIPAILLSLKDLNIDFDSSTVTEDDLTNKGEC